MKKILPIILSFVFCFALCVNFTSCTKVVSDETQFFTRAGLKRSGVPNLPKPDFKYKYCYWTTIYGDIEKETFESYAQDVLDYILSLYDYVGTIGYEYGTFFGGAGRYKFVECDTSLSSYASETEISKTYTFVFFRKKPSVGDETTDSIELTYYNKPMREGGSQIYFNFQMQLKNIGLQSTFIYNFEEGFEEFRGRKSHNWSSQTNYPVIEIIRTAEDWEKYSEDFYQNVNFDSHFIVLLTLSTHHSLVYYELDTITATDGKFVFDFKEGYYWSENGEGTEEMGTYTVAIMLDNYVKINSPDDIVVKFSKKDNSSHS